MMVRRSVPLADAIRISGLEVLSGSLRDPALFKTSEPDTEASYTTVPIEGEVTTEEAMESISRRNLRHADFWDLLAFAREIQGGRHVVALGTSAMVNGVRSFPCVSTRGKRPCLFIKRNDITIGPECEVLVVQQVLVR